MPLMKMSLDEMLEEIGFESFTKYDYIVPRDVPRRVLFTFIDYLEELSSFLALEGVDIANGTGYGDNDCPVFGALDNAFYRGNLEQEEYTITVKVFSGKKGVVVRIKDSGQGFDFAKVQEKFEKREKYYQGSGLGFRVYNNKVAYASFEGDGSTLNLMYKFGGLTLYEQIGISYCERLVRSRVETDKSIK